MTEKGWLRESDLDDWTEVINSDGETLGWIRKRDLNRLNIRTKVIETPKRFMIDPYVLYHSKLAYERGAFENDDLSEVQVVLLASNIVKNREIEETLRKRAFEESMLVNNPDMFKAYQKQKEEEKMLQAEDVQEQVPTSMEELVAMLSEFDGKSGAESGQGEEGWLSSYLSDDELDSMGDD